MVRSTSVGQSGEVGITSGTALDAIDAWPGAGGPPDPPIIGPAAVVRRSLSAKGFPTS